MKKYDPKSKIASEFICDDEIRDTLSFAKENCGNKELVESILEKACAFKGYGIMMDMALLE